MTITIDERIIITTTELQRLRAVEDVARELAEIIRENLYDGSQAYRDPGPGAERADQALTRAAELGLLAEAEWREMPSAGAMVDWLIERTRADTIAWLMGPDGPVANSLDMMGIDLRGEIR